VKDAQLLVIGAVYRGLLLLFDKEVKKSSSFFAGVY
jgi:hypothetical protein